MVGKTKHEKTILIALALVILSGCERYVKFGESDGTLIVRDQQNGKLYSVNGYTGQMTELWTSQ